MTCPYRDEDGEQCMCSAGHHGEHVTLHWLREGAQALPYVRRRSA